MKTPQLPRITQLKSALTLTIKLSLILFATLAIFHQDTITLTKHPTKQTNEKSMVPP